MSNSEHGRAPSIDCRPPIWRRRLLVGTTTVALLVTGSAAAAAAAARPATRAVAESAQDHAPAVVPGTDLLQNGSAEVGDPSGNGYDAVTIPGWQVTAGLPSVIRYDLTHFVPAAAPRPADSGHQLFVGGAGGPATLTQTVPLLSPDGGGLPVGTVYDLSAALGARGDRPESASVQLRFLGAHRRLLSMVTLGPVTTRQRHNTTELVHRERTGPIPDGTRSAVVAIHLDTRKKDDNGPDGSTVGFDSAYADDLVLTVSRPVRAVRALEPPTPHVPNFQHVVVVYLENQDYGDIVGNTAQAPFTNQLIAGGSLLSQSYAEEHPSDANYLALAAGSALDLPLTDPAEENSQYTIDARNVGDTVTEAHKSWKAYLQSADGPCDDTVHNQYWDDDLPFLYFKDVRERAAYCSAHVVPQSRWTQDLRQTSTTPSFSWLGANDCDDMEGCGIRAGDSWLRSVIEPLLRSPAWTTQRTLLVLTWDEDAQDGQHPAQRIPTILVGSRMVKRGYVSPVRSTQYSLLRTIEAGLGLPTLTANDRYAAAVNDVFSSRATGLDTVSAAATSTGVAAPAAVRPAAPVSPTTSTVPSLPRLSAGGRAWVLDSMSGTVTPVDLASGRAGTPIPVGSDPDAAVTAGGGRTLWVADGGSAEVTPVDTATGMAGPAVRVGSRPSALALTPDGRTLLVTDEGSGTVTPISTATHRAGRPIPVGGSPWAITVSGRADIAYVLDHDPGMVTPIDLRTLRALTPIRVGAYPVAETLSPDGHWLYVANFGSDTVTPIDTRTLRARAAIGVGQAPMAIAFLPDGSRAYVVDGDTDDVIPIAVATRRAGGPIRVGSSPEAAVALPGGHTVLVLDTVSGTVTPVSTATGATGTSIDVGAYGYPTALSLAPGGHTAYAVDTYSGTVVPIDVATMRARRPIALDSSSFPVAMIAGGPGAD